MALTKLTVNKRRWAIVRLCGNDLRENCYKVALTGIVVKGCSRVLRLLTTGKPDNCYKASCPSILTNSARISRPDMSTSLARFSPAGCILDTPGLQQHSFSCLLLFTVCVIYFAAIVEQSIVISMSAFLHVCLFANISPEPHVQSSQNKVWVRLLL